jgi:curved DNA-binding protein CbpA
MDLYDILSVPKDASDIMITKAYKKLAKIHHPDKPTGNTEKFQEINYAYNILINDKTRTQYNMMKKPNKNKLTEFLRNWFNQSNYKNLFNYNETVVNNIMDNLEGYDFNDLLNLFNNNIIPTKKNETTTDCSESETPYWDEFSAEYYDNDLPLKYHLYNKNNIKIDLKCTLEEIEKNYIRKIKIKRKMNDNFIETYFYFNCNHHFIVFNNGGDENGHLIISLSLPDNYTWLAENIYYNIDINLYQFIYGIELPEFKIQKWIPYINGTIINLRYVDKYIYSIKLNINYNDNINNKKILESLCTN